MRYEQTAIFPNLFTSPVRPETLVSRKKIIAEIVAKIAEIDAGFAEICYR